MQEDVIRCEGESHYFAQHNNANNRTRQTSRVDVSFQVERIIELLAYQT